MGKVALTPEEIKASRADIEARLKEAKGAERVAAYDRQKVESELYRLQRRTCPHANTEEINTPWQGGGLYFRRVKCLDCGRSGDRYDRELTNQENRKMHADWKLKGEPAEAPERARGFCLDDNDVNW